MPSGLSDVRGNMSDSSSPKRTPFISCHNCRSRKVKCTGEKPACSNCEKRDLRCSYDVHVRRRGPDKLPGGRLRNRAKPPLELPPASPRSSPSSQQIVVRNLDHHPPLTMPTLASLQAGHPAYHPYRRSPPHESVTLPAISALVQKSTAAAERRHLDHVAPRDHGELWCDHAPLYDPPGDIEHARDGWWSWILSAYPGDRAQRQRTVTSDIKYFFAEGHIFHNFLNRATFFRSLFAADSRLHLAPHVVLAMLAQVKLTRDPHNPFNAKMSLRFAEEAHAIVEYCLNSGSREPNLAQAALILGVYEMLPHPKHSCQRSQVAQIQIDACVRACLFPTLDAGHPRHISHTSTQDVQMHEGSPSIETIPRSPQANYEVQVDDRINRWASLPAWSDDWSLAEIQKEEMRRMYWSASAQAASLSAWRLIQGKTALRVSTMAPLDDLSLLFPGEAYHELSASPLDTREIPSSLYYRAVALFNIVANRLDRLDRFQRYEIVQQVEKIEEALRQYRPLANYYVWQAKEWTLATRVRLKAVHFFQIEDWFEAHIGILQLFANPPQGLPGFTDRPLYTWWYLMQGHLAIRMSSATRSYWAQTDRLLSLVYQAVEAITAIWPCPAAEEALADLRARYQGCAPLRMTEGEQNTTLTGAYCPLI